MAVARIPGRVALDGIELLRAGFWSFESFELDGGREPASRARQGDQAAGSAACRDQAHVPRRTRRSARRLQSRRLPPCARYFFSGRTCFLSRASGLPRPASPWTAMAARSPRSITSICRGCTGRATSPRMPTTSSPVPAARGGYVIDSRSPGSTTMCCCSTSRACIRASSAPSASIRSRSPDPGDDPVPGFDGARFSRTEAILPDLVAELWAVRDRAKAEGPRRPFPGGEDPDELALRRARRQWLPLFSTRASPAASPGGGTRSSRKAGT